MKLYFYCSSSSLLEYFTVNKIVCNDYLSNRNRKIVSSLGLVSGKFLFITPKKLIIEKRKMGFDKDFMEVGSVIEVSFSDEDAKSIPAVLIDNNGKASDGFIPISEIQNTDMGAFIKGEIPFSFMTGIYFDNDGAKDDIYRPSKDLYFPEHLYSVVDDSFFDDIDVDLLLTAGKAIDDRFKDENVVPDMVKRNKITSIILNLIFETKNWPYGEKYKANFDDISADHLNILDKLDDYTEGMYSKLKDDEYRDKILERIDDNNDASTMAPFLNAIVSELIPLTVTTFSQKDFDTLIDKVMNTVTKKYTENQIEDISKKIKIMEEIVYGSTNYGLEKFMDELPREYAVLKALVFFLRSPSSALKLSEGLNVYKVEPDVYRYSWIMFAALNGLEPISSEKTGNDCVMQIAESKAMSRVPIENSINSLPMDYSVSSSFTPVIEEDVSAQLVRSLIMSDEYSNKLSELIILIAGNTVLKKGFKENNYKMIFNPFVSGYPTQEYISQKDADDYINNLKNSVKKAKTQYDTEKFLNDYIRDEKAFTVLYKKDEDFWKLIYRNRNK